MIQFDYPSGGISRKERRKYTFSNFRGVDTSVAKINVDPSRAVESTNFVDRNGVLHKRFGWEQVYQFDGAINGFWVFTLVDNAKQKVFTICYAGTAFYFLGKDGWSKIYEDTNTLVSRRTSCYVQSDRAYFIGCGDFLVLRYDRKEDDFIFHSVREDEGVYIPTTTAQIHPDGRGKQYVRDSVNLLTGWRINTLVPYPVENDENSGEPIPLHYQLDSFLHANYIPEISLKIIDKDSGKTEIEKICFEGKSSTEFFKEGETSFRESSRLGLYFDDAKIKGSADINAWVLKVQTNGGEEWGAKWEEEEFSAKSFVSSPKFDKLKKVLALFVVSEEQEKLGVLTRVYEVKKADGSAIFLNKSEWASYKDGASDDLLSDFYSVSPDIISDLIPITELTSSMSGEVTEESGLIYFTIPEFWYGDPAGDDFAAHLSASGVLSVSKWPYTEEGKSADVSIKFYVDSYNYKKVTTSKCSTLYGVNGEANRLFLANSDSADTKNLILFSELNDFTYFPDDFTKVVGGNANEVKGFLRLANGSMAALKSFAQNEPTVFVFTGDYIDGYYDSERTEPYTLPRFSTSGVSTTQGILSPYACSNLADDSLFLSQNGVYALELSSGMESQRFAKERSLPINKLLKECNISELEDAVAVTHENKYYLAVKHYKRTSDKAVDRSKTYYILKDGVYTVAEYPSADLGMHNYYEREDFVYVADAHYSFKPDGAMADAPSYEWYPLNNMPVYNWFIVGEELYFGTEDGRICRFVENSYRDVKKTYFATKSYSDASIKRISQSQAMVVQEYLDTDNNGKIDTFTIAEALDVQDGDTLEFLSGELEHEVPVGYNEETGALIVERQSVIGKRFTVYRAKDKNGNFLGIQLTYEDEGGIVQFSGGGAFTAVIERQSIVKAYRETPTFDFGMPDYLKALESFTIVMNGVEGGEMNLRIATRNRLDQEEQAEGQKAFNLLKGVGYNSYNVAFQNSYTKAVAIRNFNYASMKISNETETDCSVASISLQYKYNTRSRGVR